MIRARDTVGAKTIGAVHIRDGTGLASIGKVRVRDAAGLKLVWSASDGPLSVAVTPSSAFGARLSSVATDVPSEQVTATASGGQGAATYAWTKLTGDASWSCDNPGLATTRFRRADVGPGLSYSSSWRCTVTDAAGTIVTGDVSVTVENLGDPRGTA